MHGYYSDKKPNGVKNRIIASLLTFAVLLTSVSAGTRLLVGADETDVFTRSVSWVDEPNGIARVDVTVDGAGDGAAGGDKVIDFENSDTSMVTSVGSNADFAIAEFTSGSGNNALKLSGSTTTSISNYVKIQIDTANATDVKYDYDYPQVLTYGGDQGVKTGVMLNDGVIYWDSVYQGGSISKNSSVDGYSIVGKKFVKLKDSATSFGNGSDQESTITITASNISNVVALIFKTYESAGVMSCYIDNITTVGNGATGAEYNDTLKNNFTYYTDSSHTPTYTAGTSFTAANGGSTVKWEIADYTATSTLSYYVKINPKPTANGLQNLAVGSDSPLKVGSAAASFTSDNNTLAVHGTGFSVQTLSKTAAWTDGQTQSNARVTVGLKSNVWTDKSATFTDVISSNFTYKGSPTMKVNGASVTPNVTVSGQTATFTLTPEQLNLGVVLTYDITRASGLSYGTGISVGNGVLKFENTAAARAQYTSDTVTATLDYVDYTPIPSIQKEFVWTDAQNHVARVTVSARITNNVQVGTVTYTDTFDTSKFELYGSNPSAVSSGGSVNWSFEISQTTQTLTYYLKLKDSIVYDESKYTKNGDKYELTLSDNGGQAVSVTVGTASANVPAQTVSLRINPATVNVSKTVTGAANSTNSYSFGIYSDGAAYKTVGPIAAGAQQSVSIFKKGEFVLYELLGGNPITSELETQQNLIYTFETVSPKSYSSKLWAGTTESGAEVQNGIALAGTSVNSGNGAQFNGYVKFNAFPNTAISFTSTYGTVSGGSTTDSSGKATFNLSLTADEVKTLCASGGSGSVDIKAQINGSTVTVATATVTINHKISFNANGGSGTAPEAIFVPYGCTFVYPTTTLTKDGSTFIGWAASSAATSGTAAGTTSQAVTADATYYAVWQTDSSEFTATFKKDAAETQTHAVLTVQSGQSIGSDVSWPGDPTKDGYTFKGWYVEGDTSKLYGKGLINTYEMAANVTFIAQWEQINTGEVPAPDRSFLREMRKGKTTKGDASLVIEIPGGIPANATKFVFYYASNADLTEGGIYGKLLPYSAADFAGSAWTDLGGYSATSIYNFNLPAAAKGGQTTNPTPSTTGELVQYNSGTTVTKWTKYELDLSTLTSDKTTYKSFLLNVAQFNTNDNPNFYSVYFDNFALLLDDGSYQMIEDFNSYAPYTYYNPQNNLANGYNLSETSPDYRPSVPSYFGLCKNGLSKYAHFGLVEIVNEGNTPTFTETYALYDWSQIALSSSGTTYEWKQSQGTGPQYGFANNTSEAGLYNEYTKDAFAGTNVYNAELQAAAQNGYLGIYKPAGTRDTYRIINTFGLSNARRNNYDGVTFTVESKMQNKIIMRIEGSNFENRAPKISKVDGISVTSQTWDPQYNGAFIPSRTHDEYNIDGLSGEYTMFYVYPGKQTYTLSFDMLDSLIGATTVTTSAGSYEFRIFHFPDGNNGDTVTAYDTAGNSHTITYNCSPSTYDLNISFVRSGTAINNKTEALNLIMSDILLFKSAVANSALTNNASVLSAAPEYAAAASYNGILNNIEDVDVSVPTLRASGLLRSDGSVMTVGGSSGASVSRSAVTYASGQAFTIYEHARLALADYSGEAVGGSSKYLQIALSPESTDDGYDAFASYANINAENVYYGFKIRRTDQSGNTVTATNAKYTIEYQNSGGEWVTLGTYTTSGGTVTVNEVAKTGVTYRVAEISPPAGYGQGKCNGEYSYEFTLSESDISSNYCTLTFASSARTDSVVKTIKWVDAASKTAEITVTPTLGAKQQSGTAVLTAAFTDTIGSSFTYVAGSASTDNGTATISGSTLSWSIDNIALEPSLTYRVKLTDAAYAAITGTAALNENGQSGKLVYAGTTYTEGGTQFNDPTLGVAAKPLNITVSYTCDPSDRAKTTAYAGIYNASGKTVKSLNMTTPANFTLNSTGNYNLGEFDGAAGTNLLVSTDQMSIVYNVGGTASGSFTVASTPSISTNGATLTATYNIGGSSEVAASISEVYNAFTLRIYNRSGSEDGTILSIGDTNDGTFEVYVSDNGADWTQCAAAAVSDVNGDYLELSNYYPGKYYRIINTKAPNGHQLMIADKVVSPNSLTPVGTDYVVNVVNLPLIAAVPLTGGAGTAAFMLCGMALIIAAGALFIAYKTPRRRRSR